MKYKIKSAVITVKNEVELPEGVTPFMIDPPQVWSARGTIGPFHEVEGVAYYLEPVKEEKKTG